MTNKNNNILPETKLQSQHNKMFCLISNSNILVDCNVAFLKFFKLEDKVLTVETSITEVFIGDFQPLLEIAISDVVDHLQYELVVEVEGLKYTLIISILSTIMGKEMTLSANELACNKLKNFTSDEVVQNIALVSSGLAHDANNVTTSIMANLHLLSDPESLSISEHREILDDLIFQSNYMHNIMKDMLSLVKSGSRFEAAVTTIDINELLGQLLNTTTILDVIHRCNNARVEYKAGAVANIEGISHHLIELFSNIITNALESIVSTNGKVSIETSYTKVTETLTADYGAVPSGEYVLITVADNGCGIEPMELTEIFQPMYSKKPSDYSGSGLGMMIVQNAIQSHEGYILINSTVGEGTKFSVYLPAI